MTGATVASSRAKSARSAEVRSTKRDTAAYVLASVALAPTGGSGCCAQDLVDEAGCAADDVLAVVHDQDGAAVLELLDEPARRVSALSARMVHDARLTQVEGGEEGLGDGCLGPVRARARGGGQSQAG